MGLTNKKSFDDWLREDHQEFRELECQVVALVEFVRDVSSLLDEAATERGSVGNACALLFGGQFSCLRGCLGLAQAGAGDITPMIVRRMFEQHINILAIGFGTGSNASSEDLADRFVGYGQVKFHESMSFFRDEILTDEGAQPFNERFWKETRMKSDAARGLFEVKRSPQYWHPYDSFKELVQKVKRQATDGIIPIDCDPWQEQSFAEVNQLYWVYLSDYVHGGCMSLAARLNQDDDGLGWIQYNNHRNCDYIYHALILFSLSIASLATILDRRLEFYERMRGFYGRSEEDFPENLRRIMVTAQPGDQWCRCGDLHS